jgi:uncharacterized protein
MQHLGKASMRFPALLLASLFGALSRHKVLLYCFTLGMLLMSVLILGKVTLNEDIRPMLPDRDPGLSADFALFQKAPFAQKVLINLKVDPGTSPAEAITVSDRIAAALTPPYFSRVLSGPAAINPGALSAWLTAGLPGLVSDEDMKRIQGSIAPDAVRKHLETLYGKLQSPEGWAMKSLLREDPLEFSALGFEKLRHLNFLKGMKIENGRLFSTDGRNVLLIAETPIALTDTKGSRDLVQYTRTLLDRNVPEKMSASFVSGHAYTAANSGTIRRDLFVVLTCASVAILLLLLLFMRDWRALFVYLVPTSVVCIATAATVLTYQSISAVTIAFGSVLLGISDDYPIFIFFSLRNKGDVQGEEMGAISRPVLFSGMTTMAIFAVLFFSDLPGQRQIAYFSIVGIVASLAFSILVLPHLLRGMKRQGPSFQNRGREARPLRRIPVLALWGTVMILSIWQAGSLSFNGDMRAVSQVPASIKEAEAHLKETWGDFRSSAMAVSEGASLEEALNRNDRLYGYLKENAVPDQIVSISPVLPSARTRLRNEERWAAFWTEEKIGQLKGLLASEGNRMGFRPDAFDPFFSRLRGKGEITTLDGLREAGLGELMDSFIWREGNTYRIMTLLPDTPVVSALFSAGNGKPDGTRFVSQRRFNETISTAMSRNFIKYLLIASVVLIVLLSVLFRDVRKVILALTPVITGLCLMFGIMGWAGIEFNLFNVIATLLVIGLGIDLGIFMVSKVTEGVDRNTQLAVTLSGLTSLVGLGALMLARHPSLYSIGITVFLGMCGAIPAAVLVVPALSSTSMFRKRSSQRPGGDAEEGL